MFQVRKADRCFSGRLVTFLGSGDPDLRQCASAISKDAAFGDRYSFPRQRNNRQQLGMSTPE
ncbi:hypothetical protein ACP4OV_015410 [Aristida adscensionis]